MAEFKNNFMRSKMNKDLDDRLMPAGEYRDALNVSINKSQGDGQGEGNVGTLQTVLGNKLITSLTLSNLNNFSASPSNAEVIGILPSDANNSVYAFLTNNTLTQEQAAYIPNGAVGITSSYPNFQTSNTITGSLISAGAGYTASAVYATTSEGPGTGLSIRVLTVDSDGGILTFEVVSQGVGYSFGEIVTLSLTGSSGSAATVAAAILVDGIKGPITIVTAGTGYTSPVSGATTTTGDGSGMIVSCTVAAGAVTFIEILNFGGGYKKDDIVTVVGGNSDCTFKVDFLMNSFSAIISYNLVEQSNLKIIAEGPWLNFSTKNPIYGINLIEDLLFFTDNRNQPRKVNINRPEGYYTNEDQISVAKYYPCNAINLFQPSSQETATTTGVSDAVNNSTTLTLATTSGPAPLNLGVLGSKATRIGTGGTGYTNPGTVGVVCKGGTGRGATVTFTETGGAVNNDIVIQNIGTGYTNGDILTISSGNSDATFTLNLITPETFVTDSTNWSSKTVVLNNAQTIPSGMNINFVEPQTTMQNASDLYLPASAEATVASYDAAIPKIVINPTEYKGYFVTGSTAGTNFLMANYHVYVEYSTVGNQQNVFVDSGSKVIAISQSGSTNNIEVTLDQAASPVIVAASRIRLALPNPYYDANFANSANTEFLSDKFARFSYRFKFDDGEYSLMAPFTQPCFIPDQDGYFLDRQGLAAVTTTTNIANKPETEISDEENTYRSTEVDFMKNKVNKITLNIPLPCSANNFLNEFKVEEIDILYKQSDQTSIKVLDSVPVENNVSGDGFIYEYEYGSKPPFKTLPQAETTRVYDKVPVKALSQEVASNRVIYGNFQNKHTPPRFLDYSLSTGPKTNFNVSQNIVNSGTSSVEYPNANLKQNRTYEAGVVLADRFGRQSTVLFSEQTEFIELGQFLSSSIYSPYRNQYETVPGNLVHGFDGDALNLQFNSPITSFKNLNLGTPGLYNGDINSPNYNPLGWYSFKIVVKQSEQEYYNVYIPTAMAAYPDDPLKELGSTSHIVLYNDNINKIPRDLTEVGPTQNEFLSSVRLFGRVAPLRSTNITSNTADQADNTINAQFYPSKIADVSTTVATIKDLFDYQAFPSTAPEILSTGVGPRKYIFYNFDFLSISGTGNSFPDSSSLIARINTQQKFGAQIPEGSTVATAVSDLTNPSPPPATLPNEERVDVQLSNILPATSVSSGVDVIRPGMTMIGAGVPPNTKVRSFVAASNTVGVVTLDTPVAVPNNAFLKFEGGSSPFTGTPALNVYETEPVISNLDIYYETSTSGKISDLNKAYDEGPPPNVFANLENFLPNANFNEDAVVNGTTLADPNALRVTGPFYPVTAQGLEFANPALNVVKLISVTDQNGDSSFNGIPYFDTNNGAEPDGSRNGIFGIIQNNSSSPDGRFIIVLKNIASPGFQASADGTVPAGQTNIPLRQITSASSWPSGERTYSGPGTTNPTQQAGFDFQGYNPGASSIGAVVNIYQADPSLPQIPEGTLVNQFIANTPPITGTGGVAISNATTNEIPDGTIISFGASSPGLVFNSGTEGLPGNNFIFEFECSNGGNTAIITNNLTIKAARPKRPKVTLPFGGNFGLAGPTLDQVGPPVVNVINNVNVQSIQPVIFNPDTLLSNNTPPTDVLCLVNATNGCSTINLQRVDLSIKIVNMWVGTNYPGNNWRWEKLGLDQEDWTGVQLPEGGFAPAQTGFQGVENNPIYSSASNDWNNPDNHFTIQPAQNQSAGITENLIMRSDSAGTPINQNFYEIVAQQYGRLPNSENIAYCIETAAVDASSFDGPSTFSAFVFGSTRRAGFNNRLDSPVIGCSNGTGQGLGHFHFAATSRDKIFNKNSSLGRDRARNQIQGIWNGTIEPDPQTGGSPGGNTQPGASFFPFGGNSSGYATDAGEIVGLFNANGPVNFVARFTIQGLQGGVPASDVPTFSGSFNFKFIGPGLSTIPQGLTPEFKATFNGLKPNANTSPSTPYYDIPFTVESPQIVPNNIICDASNPTLNWEGNYSMSMDGTTSFTEDNGLPAQSAITISIHIFVCDPQT